MTMPVDTGREEPTMSEPMEEVDWIEEALSRCAVVAITERWHEADPLSQRWRAAQALNVAWPAAGRADRAADAEPGWFQTT